VDQRTPFSNKIPLKSPRFTRTAFIISRLVRRTTAGIVT